MSTRGEPPLPFSRSGPKLGARWMEEQFHLMPAKVFWQALTVSAAARTTLCITSRFLRHVWECSGTPPASSPQWWLSSQATPLPLSASPLWGEERGEGTVGSGLGARGWGPQVTSKWGPGERVTGGSPAAGDPWGAPHPSFLPLCAPLLTATGWPRRAPAGRAAGWWARRGGPWLGTGLGMGKGPGPGPPAPFIPAGAAVLPPGEGNKGGIGAIHSSQPLGRPPQPLSPSLGAWGPRSSPKWHLLGEKATVAQSSSMNVVAEVPGLCPAPHQALPGHSSLLSPAGHGGGPGTAGAALPGERISPLASPGEPSDCKANTCFFAQQIKTCPCTQGTLAGDAGWQESDRDDIRKGQKGLARADANLSLFFFFFSLFSLLRAFLKK